MKIVSFISVILITLTLTCNTQLNSFAISTFDISNKNVASCSIVI